MQCKNCGVEIPQRRVELGYDYCVSNECVRKCQKGLTLVAVGVNKSADQFVKMDDKTEESMKDGSLRDQRRLSHRLVREDGPSKDKQYPLNRSKPAPVVKRAPVPGTEKQRALVEVYTDRGLRPREIAEKLGLTVQQVTKIQVNIPRGRLKRRSING